MKKLFTIVTLLATLLAANVVDAKFSDEYKAKYPRRVKVERRLEPSGKQSTKIVYTLFKHTFSDGSPFQLVVRDSGGLIKICSISYGNITTRPQTYTDFSWGDGEKRHILERFLSYSERLGREKFSNFITSQITGSDLKEMKDAVVFSVEGGGTYSTPLLYPSHKWWKEWQEAVDAAAKLMTER